MGPGVGQAAGRDSSGEGGDGDFLGASKQQWQACFRRRIEAFEVLLHTVLAVCTAFSCRLVDVALSAGRGGPGSSAAAAGLLCFSQRRADHQPQPGNAEAKLHLGWRRLAFQELRIFWAGPVRGRACTQWSRGCQVRREREHGARVRTCVRGKGSTVKGTAASGSPQTSPRLHYIDIAPLHVSFICFPTTSFPLLPVLFLFS